MMLQKVLVISLVGFVCIGFFLGGFSDVVSMQADLVQAEPLSCIEPHRDAVQICRLLEQQILDTTVRIELESIWIAEGESGYMTQHANGHATIINGRFLITHNHYNIPLSILPESGGEAVYTSVTIHKADDGQVLFKAPLTDFTVVVEEAQTLVFDLGEASSLQLAAAGLVSAESKPLTSISLQPGTEVAEIDWDGETAHVDWVTIRAVIVDQETPYLELDNYIKVGASGGGTFWNGYHIGNNWAHVAVHDGTGHDLEEYSLVAMNSEQIVPEYFD